MYGTKKKKKHVEIKQLNVIITVFVLKHYNRPLREVLRQFSH